MEIKKILWPTDLSENAATALPLVTSLSQKYSAEIHILYGLKDYPEFGASYGGNGSRKPPKNGWTKSAKIF